MCSPSNETLTDAPTSSSIPVHCKPAEPEGKGDMYWNIPLDVSTVNEIDQIKSYPDVTSDKQYHGSQFEDTEISKYWIVRVGRKKNLIVNGCVRHWGLGGRSKNA